MSIFRRLLWLALVLFLFAPSESRVLKEEMMNLNQRVEGLRQYLLEEAKKNQFQQVERTSPGGPDGVHHK
ncbi:hypothetical protein ES332_D06G170500v1 [Gossypium tomentosum]|uniref:Uncharacterized protein n=1 Tax=Gossypium tomentosum TaxID=34277 RepID=A0A5D2KJ52_GOSTO|nr:hypothetical protein ES332_D06G170500v1 [Gossypium tomentosum]